MNKEEIAPGIVVYSDVIPDSENLYKEIEEGMKAAGISWGEARVKEQDANHVNPNARDTSIIGVPYNGKIVELDTEDVAEAFNRNVSNLFFSHFDKLEKDYVSMFLTDTEWHDTYGVLKYGKGQQFTNHIDDCVAFHRRVSTVYYLNDNYTGGEINFPRFGVTYKPKANQMIVFPSTFVYNHSVSPVIEGERYAVVSWLR
jgi:predicted 2-oxoglutarate/Fe(II)-dependent dioxygenase YbiX